MRKMLWLACCVVGGFSASAVADGIAPSFLTQPLSQAVVVGGDVSFMVDVAGDEPLFYQWREGGIDIPGATDSTYSIFNLTFGDAGSYDVVASNGFGISISDVAILTVLEGTAPSFLTQPLSQAVAVGHEVSFSVDVSGTEPLTFQWRKDGVDIPGATDSMYSILSAVPDDAGSYDVVASNGFGTATSEAAQLTIVPEPPTAILLAPALFAIVAGSWRPGRR